MATTAQAIAFIETISPIAVKVCKERGYGNAQVWPWVAQACCESAYGTSNLMKNANAFFGIKATQAWVTAAKYGGMVYNSKTSECYDGKNYTQITACFRAYKNMEDSVRDYFDLIEGTRYRASLTKTTVLDAITVIKNGGYATSPTYISTITSIYKKFQPYMEKYTVDGPKLVEYYPQFQDSIVNSLMCVGEKDTSFDHRKKIAIANGISNYSGAAEQNNYMVSLIREGKLIKA